MKNINTWTNTNTQTDNTKQQIPVQNSARHDLILTLSLDWGSFTSYTFVG